MSIINYLELPLKEGEFLLENNHKVCEVNGEVVEMKYCSHCKEWHALSDYNRRSSSKDGLCYWCRDCQADYYNQKKAVKSPSAQGYRKSEEPSAPIEPKQVVKTDYFDQVLDILSELQRRDEEQRGEIEKLKEEVKSLRQKEVDLKSLSMREIETILKSNKVDLRLLFEAIARQEGKYSFYAIDSETGLTSPIRLERVVA